MSINIIVPNVVATYSEVGTSCTFCCRLLEEIEEVLCGRSEVTAEDLDNLTYLEQVVHAEIMLLSNFTSL